MDATPSELSAAALHGESGDLHGAAGAGVGKGLALPGATGAGAVPKSWIPYPQNKWGIYMKYNDIILI